MSDSQNQGGMGSFIFGLALGAALGYFLDPAEGAGRRAGIGSLFGFASDAAPATVQHVANKAYGVVQETVRTNQPDNSNPDDLTLRDRVESEILRDPTIKQSDVIFSVVSGVVELRGELPTQAAIDGLIARVREIANVKGVASYLHLPNTPAPNKESALHTS